MTWQNMSGWFDETLTKIGHVAGRGLALSASLKRLLCARHVVSIPTVDFFKRNIAHLSDDNYHNYYITKSYMNNNVTLKLN